MTRRISSMGYASKVRGKIEAPAQMSEEGPHISDTAARTWSAQQRDIFSWFKGTIPGNLVVVARAGTGKTTTILQGITHAPETDILLAAFNKRIAEELNSRITNTNAEAKTLHSIGYMLVREYWDGVRTARGGDDRAHELVRSVCPSNLPFTILKLVAKLHTKGREITPYVTCGEDLLPLAERFECEPEDFWRHQGYGLEFVCESAYQCMVLAAEERPKGGIDFADMIYLPLRNQWAMGNKNLVVVDEAQDMTTAQLDLALKVLKPGGRVCVVGDDRQAIYGFRGADSSSLSRLKTQLKATELKLTTTYRCGSVIVRKAQELVPDIEALQGVHAGSIARMDADRLVEAAQPGDFILSRLNAPLAGYAMQLLRSGKRAQIAGRDIAAGLKGIVRRLSKGLTSVSAFLDAVEVWRVKETKRLLLLKFEQRAALVNDQADTLHHLAADATKITEIEATIDKLFTDDGSSPAYILLSSVHKAKGLEASRVFMLHWTFRCGKTQEEDNIYYVAVTRAKYTLVFVENTP
jgi:DNA helicase-2/ATP-dependent DNA helicase PcrA